MNISTTTFYSVLPNHRVTYSNRSHSFTLNVYRCSIIAIEMRRLKAKLVYEDGSFWSANFVQTLCNGYLECWSRI